MGTRGFVSCHRPQRTVFLMRQFIEHASEYVGGGQLTCPHGDQQSDGLDGGVVGARDRGCVFPGCDRGPAQCEAHHIHPWWAAGPTSLGQPRAALPPSPSPSRTRPRTSMGLRQPRPLASPTRRRPPARDHSPTQLRPRPHPASPHPIHNHATVTPSPASKTHQQQNRHASSSPMPDATAPAKDRALTHSRMPA